MDKKKTLTLVVETNGTDECRWIFRCYSRRLVNAFEGEKYGITIMNINEGDFLEKFRKMEIDRDALINRVEELEGQITSLEYRLHDNVTKA